LTKYFVVKNSALFKGKGEKLRMLIRNEGNLSTYTVQVSKEMDKKDEIILEITGVIVSIISSKLI